jgi:PEP-CTERM motif-containing protein
MRISRLPLALTFVAIGTLATAQTAGASVMTIGAGSFGPGSTLTTFTGLTDGLEVNGLTVNGILFQYSLGSGQLIIDGGPGITNNINPPNIVSIGNPSGTLRITLPSAVDAFGFGFALLSTSVVPAATTLSLFNGATAVGSLSFSGAPDPAFTGGFAGILSTLAFDRVDVTFNSSAAPAFALDNIRTASEASVVPEPGTLLLLATGLGALCARRRRV